MIRVSNRSLERLQAQLATTARGLHDGRLAESRPSGRARTATTSSPPSSSSTRRAARIEREGARWSCCAPGHRGAARGTATGPSRSGTTTGRLGSSARVAPSRAALQPRRKRRVVLRDRPSPARRGVTLQYAGATPEHARAPVPGSRVCRRRVLVRHGTCLSVVGSYPWREVSSCETMRAVVLAASAAAVLVFLSGPSGTCEWMDRTCRGCRHPRNRGPIPAGPPSGRVCTTAPRASGRACSAESSSSAGPSSARSPGTTGKVGRDADATGQRLHRGAKGFGEGLRDGLKYTGQKIGSLFSDSDGKGGR